MKTLMESTSGITAKVDLSNQVSVVVAKKAMDLQKQQGEAALQLLQAATEAQADQDGHIDVYA